MKTIITAILFAVIATTFSVDANAWGGTIWCKVNMGKIEGCYPTFDQCNNSMGFGTCQPFKE